MRAPLGSQVIVTNVDNGQSVRAEVTDQGGFEPYGYIADLTISTRDSIGGRGKTSVRIDLICEC